MITLENLIQRFRVFADAHLVVKTFTHGQRADFNNMKDDEFPLMHVEYLPVSYPYTREGGEAVFSFRIGFADKPTIEEDKTEQGHYSLNDMMLCAQDLLAQIKQDNDVWYEDIEISGTPRLEWFQESFSNNLWGCVLNIDLSVPFNYNECDAPIAPITLPSSADCPECPECSSLCELIAGATITGIVDCLSPEQLTDLRAEICEVCEFTPIRLLATTDTLYDEIETEPVGGEFTLPDFPVNIGGSLTPIDLPLDTLLNIVVAGYVSHTFITVAGIGSAITITAAATYRNSASPTFTQAINSGSAFTAPEITVTEVDGVTTRNEAPNEDIVCAWVNIQVRASDGGAIVSGGLITSYPSGGNADVAFYRFRQPSGTQFGGNIPYRQSLQLMNADISDVTNTGGITQVTVTLPLNIPADALWTAIKAEMTATQITAAEDDLCEACPTPSGIVYQGLKPLNNVSYRTGDAFNLFQGGHMTPADPTTPVRVARLDEASALYPTVLAANNKWGNTWRFTDLDGNPAGGVGTWGHVEWNSHTFPVGKENIVKDHYTGALIPIVRFEDGAKFSMNSATADGQSWEDWIDAANALTTYLGIADVKWMMLPLDSNLPHFARTAMDGSSTGYDWTTNFFSVSDTPVANRVQFVTAETNKIFTSAYMAYRDSGVPDLVSTDNSTSPATTIGVLKAGGNSFIFNTCRIFLVAMDVNDDY